MKPYEEAVDLWLSFYELLPDGIYSNEGAKSEAKKYALICFSRILSIVPQKKEWRKETLLQMEAMLDNPDDFDKPQSDIYNYWQSVKTEIEKL